MSVYPDRRGRAREQPDGSHARVSYGAATIAQGPRDARTSDSAFPGVRHSMSPGAPTRAATRDNMGGDRLKRVMEIGNLFHEQSQYHVWNYSMFEKHRNIFPEIE
jgi:hypothetical protein